MPLRKSKGSNLLDIFRLYSPKIMTNGQIRMECPFRDNHTDGSGQYSFFVSPDINAYHCFSCRAKGNLVNLLTTQFGIGYFDAVGMVRLTEYTPEVKEFDLDISWSVDKFPKEFLKRGYTKETLKHFKVGMTSDDEIVIPYYRNFNKPTELVGYQKRVYNPDRRVLNSKSFDKKNYLYNLDLSKDYVILAEGQSDVWRLYQHGYNACALMGSDISSQQISQLSKFKKVYLALDNDLAGRKGTEICYSLLRNSSDIYLIPYSTKDPGECSSKEEWDNAFNSATDYLEYSIAMADGWDDYLSMRDEVIEELKHRMG